jgi:hypothetical protein
MRCREASEIGIEHIVRYRLKVLYLFVTLDDEVERNGENTAVDDLGMILASVIPGEVSAHHEVILLSRTGRVVQIVIVTAGTEIGETFADGRLLQRRYPKSRERSPAMSFVIDQTEDELTFASGISRTNNFFAVRIIDELLDDIELSTGTVFRRHTVPEHLRDQGQRIYVPLLPIRVIVLEVGPQFDKVTAGPGNAVSRAFEIPVIRKLGSYDVSNASCYRGLFSNDNFHDLFILLVSLIYLISGFFPPLLELLLGTPSILAISVPVRASAAVLSVNGQVKIHGFHLILFFLICSKVL